ncbi:MAG: metallophosphoesterase family protein [Enterococcus sp.]|nr:metallophosphoesterase family protein [Enterococcus sp.]
MEKKLVLEHNSEVIEITHVTSDTHIGHRNIAKYTGRPYVNDENTYHMDNDLINKWNQVVPVDGTVLHLGDAALGQIAESVKWYGKAHGRKLLVPGNHDYISSIMSANRRETYAPVYAEFFTVLPELVTLTAVRGEEQIVIRASHYPTEADHRERNKLTELRPPKDGMKLIHGHTHYKQWNNPDYPLEFHVGVDAHDLTPVTAERIVDWVFAE